MKDVINTGSAAAQKIFDAYYAEYAVKTRITAPVATRVAWAEKITAAAFGVMTVCFASMLLAGSEAMVVNFALATYVAALPLMAAQAVRYITANITAPARAKDAMKQDMESLIERYRADTGTSAAVYANENATTKQAVNA